MDWPLGTTIQEGIRNCFGRREGTILWVGFLLALVVGVVVAEMVAVQRLRMLEEQRVIAGAYVYVLSDTAGVSAHHCDAANLIDGVVSAGSVTAGPVLALDAAPAMRFQSSIVSPRALGVLAGRQEAAPEPGTVSVGESAAGELRTAERAVLTMGGETLEVGSVIDFSNRAARMNRSIVEVRAGVGDAEECWIEFNRQASPYAIAELRAWFAEYPNADIRSLVAPDLAVVPDPAFELRDRPEASLWVFTGVIAGLVSVLLTWTRRKDLALARVLGLSGPGAVLLGWTELVVGLVVAVVLACFGVAIANPTVLTDPDLVLICGRSLASMALFASTLFLAGPLLVLQAPEIGSLRDR